MKQIRSRYSLRILIPLFCYGLLLALTAKYVSQMLSAGHFFYPDYFRSPTTDKLILAGLVACCVFFPFYFRNNIGQIEIIGEEIILKPFLGKTQKKAFKEILVSFDTQFSRYGMPDSFLLIKDWEGKKRMKISQYYHSNYEEIAEILKEVEIKN